MKSIFLMIPLIAACSMLGGGGGDNPSTPKQPCDRGVFHPGPYTDEASGKTCNAPGGYCDSDKSCHSSAAKCGCIK